VFWSIETGAPVEGQAQSSAGRLRSAGMRYHQHPSARVLEEEMPARGVLPLERRGCNDCGAAGACQGVSPPTGRRAPGLTPKGFPDRSVVYRDIEGLAATTKCPVGPQFENIQRN
jgi:hypothetical protein